MTRIILVDDHQIFVDGLRELLGTLAGNEVVAEANNGLELMEILKHQAADLILMDVNMPEMDGLEATRLVSQQYPEIKVLMLTMFSSTDYIRKLLKAGAHGYILKNTGKEELKEAIDNLMDNRTFYSKEVTERIMEDLQQKKKREQDYRIVELTEREKEVLILIARELTTREIADELCISHHTVETHRKNLISKLNVRSVSGLVKYAVQQGLVE